MSVYTYLYYVSSHLLTWQSWLPRRRKVCLKVGGKLIAMLRPILLVRPFLKHVPSEYTSSRPRRPYYSWHIHTNRWHLSYKSRAPSSLPSREGHFTPRGHVSLFDRTSGWESPCSTDHVHVRPAFCVRPQIAQWSAAKLPHYYCCEHNCCLLKAFQIVV